MPLSKKRLESEIKIAGCSLKRTSKGHFLVIDPDGQPIAGYAVRHPGNEVSDVYIKKIRKTLLEVKRL